MSERKGDDPPGTLAMVDTMAAHVIRLAAPIRWAVSESPSERDAIFRLRYRVVIERGWAGPEDLPDGRECDAYDDAATHIVGWDGPALAAAARLNFPSPGRLLPVEESFGLRVEPLG